MTKTLSVSAIKNGTVIDHIRSGQALRIMRLLRMLHDKQKITLGLNLTSKRIGTKDIIKIENRALSNEEANEIVVFAPEATINIIENFEVIQKVKTHLPEKIANVFLCPNPDCITRHEHVISLFHIEERGAHIKLSCHFCEKTFDQAHVKVNI